MHLDQRNNRPMVGPFMPWTSVWLAVIIVMGTAGIASGQTYNYYSQSFSISGPTSVCIDGTTTYTYYGPISTLTWTVSGGTIVGSTVGSSVQVRWSNGNNSLSATGDDTSCYYDPEYWPPQQFCDVTTYTSYAFSVSHAAVGGAVNGSTTLCSPGSGSLTLSGHSGSVSRWEYSTGGSWTNISNTSTTLSYSGITTTTSYRALVQNSGCTAYSMSATVTINPTSVGGTVSGSTSLCSPGSGSLSLSGHTGAVVRWEYSTGGAWNTISSTATSINYSSLTSTTSYRAVVKSGVCAEAQSSTATITIDVASVGGTTSGTTTLCTPGSGSITLSGHTGNIVRWEYSTGGAWQTTGGTSTTLSYSGLTVATSYRAVVKNGVCAEANSSTSTVTINAASVGGTVSGSTTLCSPGSGSLTLSGQTGSVVRWEYSTGGAWNTISSTATSINYSSLTTSTSYRAVVKNGVCAEINSSTATITINPVTNGGTLSGTTLCSPASGSLTLSGYVGTIQRWEYLTGGGNWTAITNSTNTQTYSSLTATTSYRVLVQSGVCAAAYSSVAVITVESPSVGGTLGASADVYAATATGQLTLGSPYSVIQRWEKNPGSGWIPIVQNWPTYDYSLTQSTSFRVVTKNSVCPETNSNVATINVFPAVTVTPSSPPPIAPGGTITLSANGGYAAYQWYLNGAAIASGGTAQQYQAKEPGVYYVRVTGTGASTSVNSATVTVKGIAANYDGVLNSVSSFSVLTEGLTESSSVYSLTASQVAMQVAYADGLGRVFQSIGVGQSPSGGDVIAVTGYRKHGLTDTTYLPYSIATRDGTYRRYAIRGSANENSYVTSEQRNFYQNTAKVAQDAFPYAVSLYAADPSLRVVEQGAPGQEWQPTSAHHTVRSTMTLNNTTTYKVRYWNVAGATTGNYADNSVMVSVTTDENNNKVQTYTDVRGLTVLKQVQMDETLEGVSTPWLETYYIYDEWGRIKYIVPPKAMKVLGTGASLNATNSAVAELIHTFVYDSRGRLVEKKVPGAAVQYIVYDKLDRVVLVQDGNMRAANKWMFVKYDIKNRVVYTGIYTNASQTTRPAVQALLDAIVYGPSTPWYESEQTGGAQGYSNVTFPTTFSLTNDILSVSYYDHYNFDRSGGDDYTYDASHLTGQEAARSTATRGLPTGGRRALLDAAGNVTSTLLTSVVFYDKYDRPVQTLSTNHLYPAATAATLDKSTVLYDFVKALRTKTTHYQDAVTSVTLEDYSDFDHAGRATKTYRKINNGAAQLIAQYEYNALGQVVDKKLHEVSAGGGSFLQSVDYRYTIRGWLSSINNAKLNTDNTNDETNDYFGMELLYQAVESGLGNTAYYNGNISATKWKGLGTSGAADQRSYKYAYDKSDRLKTATFQAHDGAGWAREVNTLDETMSYDHNGNILTLTRKENLRGNTGITITSTPQTIDNLSYVYPAFSPNRHIKVEDASGSAKGFNNNGVTLNNEYKYDTLGNLKEDKNKGISSISYNILGKPQVINFTSGKKIEYVYDATGTKLTVKTYQATTLLTSTNYAGSFVYEGATPALSFFGSPEGRVVKNGSSFEYQYSISDHQGNTRVIFTSATPAVLNLTATFEGDGNDNSGSFVNVNGSNVVPFTAANHTTGGTKVVRMNQTYASGPSKSIKVYPGDKIDAEVWAYYEASSGYGTGSPGVAAMVTAIASGFGGVSGGGGESGSIYSGVNSALGAFGLGGNAGDNAPAAYLNYILFDQQYKLLTMGWIRVPTSAYFSKQKINLAQVNVQEAGYVFVYLSYEDQSSNYVYFDDFKVTHTKSNLIQGNEYYPFGMQTANSWTRENTLGNNFLANGGTELNSTSNLYDLDYRHYDQVLGRMNGVDPMATKFASLTPYNFSFNDPVTLTDPSGAFPEDPYAGSMAYYYAMQGPDRSPGQMPLQVMDPYWTQADGWTTRSWTWDPSTAGGYGMMAGSYSFEFAGRGLPSTSSESRRIGSIDIDWGMMQDDAMTSIFIENGEVIGGYVLPFKLNDKNVFASSGGCPEGMDCVYRGGKMLIFDSKTGQLIDQVDLNTRALSLAIEKYAETSVEVTILAVTGELMGLATGKVIGYVAGRFMAARVSNAIVQFGRTENQIYHTFRHTDKIGLERSVVKATIANDFKSISSMVIKGEPYNRILEIGGIKVQYTAWKLSDGTFNIGRIVIL